MLPAIRWGSSRQTGGLLASESMHLSEAPDVVNGFREGGSGRATGERAHRGPLRLPEDDGPAGFRGDRGGNAVLQRVGVIEEPRSTAREAAVEVCAGRGCTPPPSVSAQAPHVSAESNATGHVPHGVVAGWGGGGVAIYIRTACPHAFARGVARDALRVQDHDAICQP